MSIQYLKRREIDVEKWDAAIEQAINGMPYAFSWYLDVIAEGRWDALVTEDYKVVFPLPWSRKLYFMQFISQPFFAQQLGVFSENKISEKTAQQFFEAIPKKFIRVQINLNSGNPRPTQNKFSTLSKENFILSLDKDYQTTYQGYSRSARNNLRKAKKAGLQFGKPLLPEIHSEFYFREIGSRVHVLKNKHYRLATKLMEKAIKRKKGEIFTVENPEGQLCAAAFYLFSHNRIINLFSAPSEVGKKMGAMYFLHDRIIYEYANSGKVFDFEGSTIPSIASFFQTFGSKNQPYHFLKFKSW